MYFFYFFGSGRMGLFRLLKNVQDWMIVLGQCYALLCSAMLARRRKGKEKRGEGRGGEEKGRKALFS